MANYINCFGVSDDCPVSATVYGYTPSLPANATLLSIFSLVAVVQFIQGTMWKPGGFMIVFVIGSLLEIVGYAGRLLLHSNPWDRTAFILPYTCTALAPIFFSAGIYLCYSHLAQVFNPSLSRISIHVWPLIAMTSNILPFLLQAIGAGIATTAIQNDTDPTLGTHLMISGLSFQAFTLVLFGIFCMEYIVRVYNHSGSITPYSTEARSTKRIRFFWGALSFSYMMILTSCIYRILELSGGWGSALMRNEANFVVFEGVLVLAAAYALCLVHPGYVFGKAVEFKDEKLTTTSDN